MEAAVARVTLRNHFAQPFDSAIAAARTCYSSRIISPGEITDKQRTTIGPATFQGGHHTVYQHAHFEFGLENISRHLVWNFLHGHPFYNSEQQSQRYVRMKEPEAFMPPLEGRAREIYAAAIDRAWEHYRELSALLEPVTHEVLADIWELERKGSPQRVQRVKAQAGKNPSGSRDTSCRWPPPQPWSTLSAGSCCIACIACANPATRRGKRRKWSAKWWRA